MNIEKYFEDLEKEVKKVYVIANEARAKGLDPVDKVEVPLAKTMAEKCVELIATIYPQMSGSGITERILELEKEYGQLDAAVSFKIAEEIAKQKFCKFSSLLEAIDAGIRIGFAYNTLGVVASPIEGFTELKLGKTKEGKEYFIAYFSGPIRSAGTTASCIVLMLIDYLRELFGYAKYDPSEEEVKRYVTENNDYHERVTNLQYFPMEEEIIFLAKNMPIQIAGEKTEKFEVSNYKNLPRVDTDYIRGGMCLIFSEGLAQKAAKGYRLLKGVKEKGFKSTGWDFLEEYIELHEKLNESKGGDSDDRPIYIRDLVAGRPVFAHPSGSGGFRFRYGRCRSSGFSAAALHPATMGITDNFIAMGTQLKIEKPTKGCAIATCDSIDGPIVKLNNGSVKQVRTREEAKKLYPDVEEIIYLGDMLFPFSDLVNRNAEMIRPGYVEEWWSLELKEKNVEIKDCYNVGFDEAVKLSREKKVSLYPKLIFYWTEISKKQFRGLLEWFEKARIVEGKIILPFNKTEEEKFSIGKRGLELLGIEHDVIIENVVINKEIAKALFVNLGIGGEGGKGFEGISRIFNEKKSVLKMVNDASDFEIRNKAGDFVGARMGRPEKAKLRKLQGSPNILFTVGKEGGRLRSVHAACEEGKVRGDFTLYFCEDCKKETIYPVCETCDSKTKKMFYCRDCDEKSFEKCEEHEENGRIGSHCYRDIDINYYFDAAREKLGLKKAEVPLLIKGVRGMSSDSKFPENLCKGILRARHELQVNKDGTIRFDGTELPLTQFKPKEIGTSVEKLKELGYNEDVYGNVLENEEQILDLMPHDVLLPSAPDSPDEKADDVFFAVSKFIDEELERFYSLKKFHNLKSKEDVIGQLGVCMAPHNCAGVICRFIGTSHTQGLMASPYMHAAIRRDCDGDEAALMLLSDVLINFSREFLPSHRGGTQDAPLVLNGKIAAGEVDDQILDLELLYEYPLDLYRKAEQRVHSSEVEVYVVKDALKEGKDVFHDVGFTHDTSNFNDGVVCSAYKLFGAMQEKVDHQMVLVEKIRAADEVDVACLVIERHFIRDIRGNLRKFSMQGFRCVGCNEILRRPPLSGVCPKCKGKIIFTIHEGGIKKYLEPSLNLANKYNLSPYIKQTIELTKRYIDSVFGKELEKQETLTSFFHSSSK